MRYYGLASKMTKSLEHEIKVKVSRSVWVPSRDIKEKPYVRFDSSRLLQLMRN